jgi:hypothetical protein
VLVNEIDAGWRLTGFDTYWRELEEMGTSGLSPVEVIHAATGTASRAVCWWRETRHATCAPWHRCAPCTSKAALFQLVASFVFQNRNSCVGCRLKPVNFVDRAALAIWLSM